MQDLRAVVNDYGVVLYVNLLTDGTTLAVLLSELGGIREQVALDRIPIRYGNGLTKERAESILKRFVD